MTREEHLKWAKKRALEYLNRGELENAVASMISDMQDIEEVSSFIMRAGALAAMGRNSSDVTAIHRRVQIGGINDAI